MPLKKAQSEFGMENFVKHIIKFFGTKDECYLAEREIVNESFAKSSLTYNMKKGGIGGWFVRAGWNHTETTKNKMRKSGSGSNNGFYGKKHSEETLKKISNSSKRPHTKDAKDKIRKAKIGVNNPMYGTVSPTAKPLLFRGKVYPSLFACHTETSVSYHFIKKEAIICQV